MHNIKIMHLVLITFTQEGLQQVTRPSQSGSSIMTVLPLMIYFAFTCCRIHQGKGITFKRFYINAV